MANEFKIQLSHGVATMILPEELSELDVERLHKLIEVSAPVTTQDDAARGPWDVVLMGYIPNLKIPTIKAIRDVTSWGGVGGFGLKEAKDALEGAPFVLSRGIPRADAEKQRRYLAEAGGLVELRPSTWADEEAAVPNPFEG